MSRKPDILMAIATIAMISGGSMFPVVDTWKHSAGIFLVITSASIASFVCGQETKR